MKIRLAVVGSRNFNDYDLLCYHVDQIKPVEIITGGARGADTLAEKYAKARNIPLKVYKAEWDNLKASPRYLKKGKYGVYNALAGFNRNTIIVDRCDAVIAFWDGRGSGTRDALDKAEKAGKTVCIVNMEED